MTEHKLAHILRAIADGKTVQSKLTAYEPVSGRVTDFGWKDLDVTNAFSLFPTNPGMEYRIKPKPLVKKWRWAVKDKASGKIFLTGLHYSSEEEYNNFTYEFVALQRIEETMIEVEED